MQPSQINVTRIQKRLPTKIKYAIIFHHVLNITCCKHISARIEFLNITVIYQISLYLFIEFSTVIKLHNQGHFHCRKVEVAIKFK